MLSLLSELEKCESLIKECENKVTALRINIAAVDKDLSSYEYLERSMEENLKILKSDKIIVLMSEFKDLRENLRRIHRKVELLKLDREVYQTKFNQVEVYFKNILIKKQSIEDELNRDNLVIFKLRSK